jgi:hypothetical protein
MEVANSLPVIKAVEKVIGKRPHVQTVRRWCKKGVRGIRLRSLFVNGSYRCSVDDVQEFLKSVTDARIEAGSIEAPKIEPTKPVKPARVAAAVAEFNRMTSRKAK